MELYDILSDFYLFLLRIYIWYKMSMPQSYGAKHMTKVNPTWGLNISLQKSNYHNGISNWLFFEEGYILTMLSWSDLYYENCCNGLSAIQRQVKFNTTDRWSYGHQFEKNTIRKSKIYFLQNAPEEISTMSGHMISGFNELTVWCPYSSNMSIDPHFHPFYQQSSQAISRVQRLPYSSTSIFRHGELIQATSHKGTSQFNSSPHGQNGCHFADDIFKWIFMSEIFFISIQISLKFVPKGVIDNMSALVQVMAWRQPGDKPLPKPMMTQLTDAYMYH